MQQKASDSYRAAYDRRRLRTAETHADWRKARAHNDALRIMTKRLLRDLWQAWRAAKAAVSTIDEMPPADPSTN